MPDDAADWSSDELRDLAELMGCAEFRRRLGLPPRGPLTLEQTGALLGMSPSRVHQVQAEAMRRIRLEMARRMRREARGRATDGTDRH